MEQEPQEIDLGEFLQGLGIQPINLQYYRQAVTHSSFLNEQGMPAWEGNERLEFLGDAVVGLAVTEYLFQTFPLRNEGELSKIKSVAVCRTTLAHCSREIGLSQPLKLGVGETRTGGKSRQSILAALFESMVGALYLDQGMPAASAFILKCLGPIIEKLGEGHSVQDDKSHLQEIVQRKTGQIPRYRVTRSEGPDHDKWFQIEVSLKGVFLARGEGSSKKNAEQQAARLALELYNQIGDQIFNIKEEQPS